MNIRIVWKDLKNKTTNRKEFYSNLELKSITDAECDHAKKV